MKSNLKIYTSFVSPKNLTDIIEDNLLPIFILRNIRNSELIGKYSDTAIHFKNLAPSDKLYQIRRDRLITREEYEKRYIIELSEQPNFQNIIKKLEQLTELCSADGVVILDYGFGNNESHRKILSNLLNNLDILNYKITEYETT
jgi:uncharacterized protein YeaO (DUF488 family)